MHSQQLELKMVMARQRLALRQQRAQPLPPPRQHLGRSSCTPAQAWRARRLALARELVVQSHLGKSEPPVTQLDR